MNIVAGYPLTFFSFFLLTPRDCLRLRLFKSDKLRHPRLSTFKGLQRYVNVANDYYSEIDSEGEGKKKVSNPLPPKESLTTSYHYYSSMSSSVEWLKAGRCHTALHFI